MRRYGDWAKAQQITSQMAGKFQNAVERALLREGHLLRAEIVKGITSGAPAGKTFAPLSPMTIAVRRFTGRGGGTKPLIASGALRASIQVHRVGGTGTGGKVFVGILRTAAGKRANIGQIHEFGAAWTMTMTPKMRRFLFAALRNSPQAMQGPRLPGGRFYSKGGIAGGGKISIRIPARPFMAPVFAKYKLGDAAIKRFWANVAEGMGFDLGKP